jgi:hypothetical protein
MKLFDIHTTVIEGNQPRQEVHIMAIKILFTDGALEMQWDVTKSQSKSKKMSSP